MSHDETAWRTILAPDDAVILQESGLISPLLPDGTRRIHKRRLNRSSDEEEEHLSLSPFSLSSVSQSPVWSTSSSESFVSIPEHLISLVTLEHLGYNSQTATRIWDHWTSWPPGEPKRESDDIYHGVPFIDVAEGYIRNFSDTCEDNDATWFHCMNQYGINTELQQAIMDPKFRHIRLIGTCKFWVRDTLKLRYRGLQAIQQTSRERDMASRREAPRPGLSRGSWQRSISDSLRMVPWLSHETALSQAATNAATNAPGYTTLYKGIDQARVSGLFVDNSKVRFECLTSTPPSDFSGRHADSYFAADREVAEYYACYVKRRSTCNAVVIIHITIPNSVIESLSPDDIQILHEPGAEWKSLVFYSRLGLKLPSELRKYQLAKLVIGAICGKPNLVFANMRSPDEVTKQMVL
ncbi:uncharacterized protein PGRI_045120 [Penicillium griseofulvum]|uniref:Uncharacterized protein n=1 Tax=Penicillium patulum TaxID=5078 RepID=A0A135LP54_PENPA|nr:uncharacterized protein PGRI_045120 [Penicillium griseofulvum]KXG50745.1 hypothetical protein PGRI_045120 [Penicillium griseofulvum]